MTWWIGLDKGRPIAPGTPPPTIMGVRQISSGDLPKGPIAELGIARNNP